jgi:hypothetical protein
MGHREKKVFSFFPKTSYWLAGMVVFISGNLLDAAFMLKGLKK